MIAARFIPWVTAGLVITLIGLSAAPPIWTGGVTPLGFFLIIIIISLYQPQALSPFVLVLLSLLQDAAVVSPFGFHGLIALLSLLLLGRVMETYQRQQFIVVTVVLAIILAVMQLLVCIVAGMMGVPVSVESALWSWLVTLPLIPLVQLFALRVILPLG
jgi:cell shape-determining protein MreD